METVMPFYILTGATLVVWIFAALNVMSDIKIFGVSLILVAAVFLTGITWVVMMNLLKEKQTGKRRK